MQAYEKDKGFLSNHDSKKPSSSTLWKSSGEEVASNAGKPPKTAPETPKLTVKPGSTAVPEKPAGSKPSSSNKDTDGSSAKPKDNNKPPKQQDNQDDAKPNYNQEAGKGSGGVDVPRISEVEIKFKINPKHDKIEFERQLKAQEEGINSLTVEEFIQNRDRYLRDGRALEGDAAQKLARQEALKEKVTELRKQGLSREEANKKAEEWLKEQAALHNPDQIAGGKPEKIGGVGDKRVNSSIGSQWKSRIRELDKQIREIASTMTKEERESTFLNIKLKY
ncbi:hypothetical protein JNUCC31_05450 [Paenibacillus sp. JNUCC31]|nr:hypothetical protein JNUCC31_05450 [Paenibacillus sp. JNUCC-31]